MSAEARLRARPWWPAAEGLRALGHDVQVQDPDGVHYTHWDHNQAHGALTVEPAPDLRTWRFVVQGSLGLEDEDSIGDAPPNLAWVDSW